ncbi:MAG: hypothetical protein ACI4QT_00160 [Kiritimatiellia bacterium]
MKWFLLSLAFICLIVVFFCLPFGNRDKRQIQRVFRTVESQLEKSGEETLIVAHRKAAALAGLIAPGCIVTAPEAGIHRVLQNGDSCLREILLARQMLSSASLSFNDLQISVSDGSTALVSGDVSLLGNSSAYDFRTLEAREMVARLQKDSDGKWRFTSVAIRPILVK